MLRRLIRSLFGRRRAAATQGAPSSAHTSGACILPRHEHGIDRTRISRCALEVCTTLSHAGYQAYVVGGAVRDLLLGRTPKDFDVATNATPEEVRALFRRSRIIGRRFRIVHVLCGRETIEVTTFRANGQKDSEDEDLRPTDEHGRLLADNVFGTMAEDAARRDFTLNALYYDPAREEIHDFFGGVADCKARILRIIGDAEARYREDPVRMLRAARFAAKLGGQMDEATRKPIHDLAPLLANIPRARMFDETLKLMLSGHAEASLEVLRSQRLDKGLLPVLDSLEGESGRFVRIALRNTDQRIAADRPVSIAFLFAALLWPQLVARWRALEAGGEKPQPALFTAMDAVLDGQRSQLALPRRHDGMMKEIWSLQPRFEQRSGQRPFRLLEHPRFRAAYDFLLLRAEAGEADPALGEWWTHFQNAGEETRAAMLVPDNAPVPRRRRRRRKPAAAETPAPTP